MVSASYNLCGSGGLLIFIDSGFTKRLMDKAEGSGKIPAYIEGPYGHGCSLDHYEQVMLVCGKPSWLPHTSGSI